MNKIQARERKGFLSQGGVLRISSDMKDFFFLGGGGGVEIFDVGTFWGVGKFWQALFGAA